MRQTNFRISKAITHEIVINNLKFARGYAIINNTPKNCPDCGKFIGDSGCAHCFKVALEDELIGLKYPNVAEITGVSPHAASRALERGVDADRIRTILSEYTASTPGNSTDSRRYHLDNNIVIIGADGIIITVW